MRDARMTLLVGLLLACMSQMAGCRSDAAGSTEHDGSAEGSESTKVVGETRNDLIPVGQKAPMFEARDHLGNEVRLGELLEQGNVMLVFYPKNDTPVCTRQLCAIRDDWSTFENKNISVLAVNPAGGESHAEFAAKHGFPFPVVVDEDSRIAAAFGAEGTLFTKRTVYVIDQNAEVLLADRGVVSHDHIFAVTD